MSEALYGSGFDHAMATLGLEKTAISLGMLERAALRAEELAAAARRTAVESGGIRRAIRKGVPKPPAWGQPMSQEAWEASGAYQKARDRAETLRVMLEGRKQGIPVQLSEARGADISRRYPAGGGKPLTDVTLGPKGGPPRPGRKAKTYEQYVEQHAALWPGGESVLGRTVRKKAPRKRVAQPKPAQPQHPPTQEGYEAFMKEMDEMNAARRAAGQPARAFKMPPELRPFHRPGR